MLYRIAHRRWQQEAQPGAHTTQDPERDEGHALFVGVRLSEELVY
jgi:hypothetical protein